MADLDVAVNLAVIRDRIQAAGGDPARVAVVAVTKGFGPEAARAACRSGLTDLGENYAQEMLAKVDHVRETVGGTPGPVRWHFLGPVQRNKVAALAPHVHLWQAVDRASAGEAIARRRPGAQVLVQVNTSGEAAKSGCHPDDTAELVAQLKEYDLHVIGLMAVGPAGPRGDKPGLAGPGGFKPGLAGPGGFKPGLAGPGGAEQARPGFRLLAGLGRRLGLSELSMGMTDDLEVAVQEGATMIRVGRGLFGPRPPRSGSPAPIGFPNGGD